MSHTAQPAIVLLPSVVKRLQQQGIIPEIREADLSSKASIDKEIAALKKQYPRNRDVLVKMGEWIVVARKKVKKPILDHLLHRFDQLIQEGV